jgi:hypothetical protein
MPDPRWMQNPDVVIREEEDGLSLAFNVTTGSGLILNRTARFILSGAASGLDAAAIQEAVLEEFDLPQGTPRGAELLEIVAAHIALLERARLLVPAETAAAA